MTGRITVMAPGRSSAPGVPVRSIRSAAPEVPESSGFTCGPSYVRNRVATRDDVSEWCCLFALKAIKISKIIAWLGRGHLADAYDKLIPLDRGTREKAECVQ